MGFARHETLPTRLAELPGEGVRMKLKGLVWKTCVKRGVGGVPNAHRQRIFWFHKPRRPRFKWKCEYDGDTHLGLVFMSFTWTTEYIYYAQGRGA